MTDRARDAQALSDLGTRAYLAGDTRQAVEYYARALALYRQLRHQPGEGDALSNLGNCYYQLGQIARAIDYYEWAQAVRQACGDRTGQGIALGNLGSCYAGLGQTAKAVAYFEQALAVARDVGDRRGEGARLGNLGNCYGELGQAERAIDYFEQALAISREVGDRLGAAISLSNLADTLIDAGRCAEAAQKARESAAILDEVGYPSGYSHSVLAAAHLCAGDLPAAHAAAEAARRFDEPLNNAAVNVLLGVIALRQAEAPAAQAAFAEALAQTSAQLAQTAENYGAHDAQGLALCGLRLLGQAPDLRAAEAAFRAARAVNRNPGVVQRVLRLFDALAEADAAGALSEMRALIAAPG